MLTIDTPYLGVKEADVRNGFELPAHFEVANFQEKELRTMRKRPVGVRKDGGGAAGGGRAAGLTWEDVGWMRGVTGGAMPVLVKGIMTAEDAVLACRAGCVGVAVSNHGGRQLDGVRPPSRC